jgi:hypothetical protein
MEWYSQGANDIIIQEYSICVITLYRSLSRRVPCRHIHFSRDRVSFGSMLIQSPLDLLLTAVTLATAFRLPPHILLHAPYLRRSDRPANFLMLHMLGLAPLISDQSNDHGVEVEEEHKQVETELDERLLLVHVKLPEDLRSVEQVLVLEDPVGHIVSIHSFERQYPPSLQIAMEVLSEQVDVLLCVPGQERQVQNERHPVAVDQEQDSQESVDTGLGDDVHVKTVAQIDRVDVVAFQVRVHDGEEHLQEEVDGINQDGKEEQPA